MKLPDEIATRLLQQWQMQNMPWLYPYPQQQQPTSDEIPDWPKGWAWGGAPDSGGEMIRVPSQNYDLPSTIGWLFRNLRQK